MEVELASGYLKKRNNSILVREFPQHCVKDSCCVVSGEHTSPVPLCLQVVLEYLFLFGILTTLLERDDAATLEPTT